MIRTRLAMWATAASLAVPTLWITPPAAADTSLPPSITTSPTADKGAERETIQKFVQEQVAKLAAEDAATRTAAREALVSRVSPAAHPVFVDFYCSEINAEIKKLLSDPKLETRLNAAIVIARIAAADKAAKLTESVILALGDKQDSVLLWGMKAAAQLLPNSLTVQQSNNPLLAKVSEVALARAGTTLVVESYDALTLTSYSTEPAALRDRFKDADWQRLARLVLPEFIKLWSARLAMYARGTVAEPMAEVIPANFISQTRSWGTVPPPTQAKAMQMLSDQLSLAGQMAAAGTPEKAAFIRVIQRTAGALQVLAVLEGNNKELADAASVAGKVVENTPGPAIQSAIAPVLTAIRKIPKFAETKPAPTVNKS